MLPQFVDRGEGHVQAQMLLLGCWRSDSGLGSDSVWALLASRLRSWFDASPNAAEAMGALGGVSMIGLGVGLAVTGRPSSDRLRVSGTPRGGRWPAGCRPPR